MKLHSFIPNHCFQYEDEFTIHRESETCFSGVALPPVKSLTHYENKFTKNIRPTDILQIYTKYLVNVLNVTKYLVNVHKFTKY